MSALLLVMDDARRLRRRAAQIGTRSRPQVQPRSAEGAADRPSREGAPAPRHEVRVKPGGACRRWPRASSRPRWPDDAKTNLKIRGACICPKPCHATSEGWWGTLPGEVKEGIGPQGQGGTRARKSPPPSPAQTRPARKTTHNPKKIQRAEARRSRCADVPRLRDKVPSRPSVPSTNVTCSVKRSRVPSGSPMNSTVATDTEWCRPFRCMS